MTWSDCLEGDVATLRCVPLIIQNVVNAALLFAGVVALILIIYSGIKFIQSKGDPQGVDSAKKTLTYAIIGLIIILLSFGILNIIAGVTGVDQLTNPTL